MKIISIYVSSLDGRTTKWGTGPREWASKEDQTHYHKTLEKNNLIVMGSNSYNTSPPKLTKGTLHIVLTQEPQKYEKFAVPEQLEFTQESPVDLVDRLEKEGYQQMLLVSGPQLTTSFFQKNLIDELWLTVEPKIFGKGYHIVNEQKISISLQLFDINKLNERGTLLIKYIVLKI